MPGRLQDDWCSEPLGPGELRGPAPDPDSELQTSEILLKGLRAQVAAGVPVAQMDAEDGSTRSYAWLLETSVQTAAALQALGMRPGDVVTIVSNVCHEVYPAFLGAVFAGLTVLIPVHTSSSEELVFYMEKCPTKVVLHDAQTEAVVRRAVDVVGGLGGGARLVRLQESEGSGSFGEFLKMGRSTSTDAFEPARVPDRDRERHPLLLLCTSGSSGMPKLVMLPDLCLSRRTSTPPPELVFMLSPLAWMSAVFNLFGSCKVPMPRLFLRDPDPESILKAIHRHKPKLFFCAPPTLALLPQSPSLSSADPPDVSSVRLVLAAGSPFSQHQVESVRQTLGWQPYIVYGSTEAGVISGNVTSPRVGASGVVVRGARLRIVDPETERVVTTPNTDGEIRVKTQSMFLGYYNDEAATRECFDAEGWYKTGDIGHWDEDGYIYVVDRIKEIFKYCLYHISPVEVEKVLVRHPGVKEAAVVGRPHPIDGALPTAFVVRKDRDSVTAGELEALVAGSLQDAKRLRGGIIFVDSIAKLPSGKINRKLLRSIVQEF